jgi:hypothetical protein
MDCDPVVPAVCAMQVFALQEMQQLVQPAAAAVAAGQPAPDLHRQVRPHATRIPQQAACSMQHTVHAHTSHAPLRPESAPDTSSSSTAARGASYMQRSLGTVWNCCCPSSVACVTSGQCAPAKMPCMLWCCRWLTRALLAKLLALAAQAASYMLLVLLFCLF